MHGGLAADGETPLSIARLLGCSPKGIRRRVQTDA
jgi:DNA-binding CsgD family transcriptional regulator